MKCPACGSRNSDYNAHCSACQQPLTVSLKTASSAASETHQSPSKGLVDKDFGKFRILEEIAEGGMGTVYKAWDSELERLVALKMLHRNFADQDSEWEQLLAEAKIASSLSHPNIVTIFEVFRGPECCFIAMEWLEGQTLADLIFQKDMVPDLVIDYALGVAKGLARAHEEGMIHRDIKPSNIMVTPDGTVKILDFGLARSANPLRSQASSDNTESLLSGIKGTPAYMSPEQLRGENLDTRTDVFSFGLVLYTACIGRHPLLESPDPSVSDRHDEAPLQPLGERRPNLPESFTALVMHCLERHRDSRPKHMGEVADQLCLLHQETNGSLHERAMSEKVGLKSILLVFGLLVASWVGWQLWDPRPSYSPIADLHSLGVIPFENLTGDPALDVYCNGLSATVNNSLTRTAADNSSIWIVPSGELRRLEHIDAGALYQSFGVTHGLSASLQYAGEGLRLHVNLIKTDSLEVVRDLVFDLPESRWGNHKAVVQSIFSLLNRTFPQWLAKDLEVSGVPGAHRLYLEGLSYNYRGDVSGNLERAQHALKKALELDPDHVSAMVALTETYYLMWTLEKKDGALEKGLIYAKKALTRRNDLASVHNAIGSLLSAKGDYEEAEKAFLQASRLKPQNSRAFYGLGVIFLNSDRYEDSEQAFLKATRINPYNWLGQSDFGHLYYRQGKMEDAEKIFRHLAELAPKNSHCQSNLAIILYTLGRVEEALVIVELALEMGPSEFLYMTRGSMAFFLEEYEKAVLSFREAIVLNPNYYFHHGNLGDGLRQLGRIDEAREAYRRAIALIQQFTKVKPDDVEAKIMRVLYLARSGEADQARIELDEIEQPNGVDLIYCYALGQELVGRRKKALEFLARAVALNYPLDEIQKEPDLTELRHDPGFQKLMVERAKLE